MKSMGQWFIWFIISWWLFVSSCVCCAPIIAHFLVQGLHPDEDLYSWRMIVAGLGSLVALFYWMTREPYYVSRKVRK